jgi:hypothetical protein
MFQNIYTIHKHRHENPKYVENICLSTRFLRDTRYRSWLRHYVTSQKVTGSIPDDVMNFFFNFPNPSIPTIVLGST